MTCRIYPLVFASVRGLLSPHARVRQRARTMRTKGSPTWTKPLNRRQTSIRPTSLSQALRFPSIRGPGPSRKRQRARRAQTLLIRANPTARSAALLEMTSFTSMARPRPTTRHPGGACRPRRSSVRKPIAIAPTMCSSCRQATCCATATGRPAGGYPSVPNNRQVGPPAPRTCPQGELVVRRAGRTPPCSTSSRRSTQGSTTSG